jgi:1,4-alpha-glucan branching enzyme
MLSKGTAAEYAKRRVGGHLDRFERLRAGLEDGRLDESVLREIEDEDNLFPEIDYRAFA